jgi:hypothetical protein
MPSKSPEQKRLMQAVAHSPKFAKKVGIPVSVGKEFAKADKMKNGGVAQSLKDAGFYEEGKSKPERLKIVNQATTKPERVQIVEKLFSSKKMKSGGLYENIHAKRERIAAGSGEKMRKVGSAGAPTAKAFKESAKTAKMKEGGVSLAVGRGEKLSTERGAGLTEKGRAKYNRETGSNLKAPQPEGGSRKDSFCARMSGVVKNAKGDAPRAKASLKRWKCAGW